MKLSIAIAGATGFLGRWFIDTFKHKYHIVALTRRKVDDRDPDVEWRSVELYSLTSTTEALRGVDMAIYLVHSMQPSTRLNQGSFEDTDLLLADNFARAAEAGGLRQIIFMSGILPEGPVHTYSRHLRSRYEVEQTLASRSVPVTTLRAGIIVGPGGSSFRILEKLVRRLPVMVVPKWTHSRTQPIALRDTLRLLDFCCGNPDTYDQAFDVGGKDTTTYYHMMIKVAELLGKRRLIFSVPFFSANFSKMWVARFADASITLVSPLVESLRHELLVGSNWLLDKVPPQVSFEQAARRALNEKNKVPPLPKSVKNEVIDAEKNTVRSVQRLPNPGNHSAAWVAHRYQTWLPRFFRYLIQVDQAGEVSTFRLGPIRLLQLQLIPNRSDDDRQLFYIMDGYLVKRKDYGWLEFRRVLGGRYVIAAIHEFVPMLPWPVYVLTQANAHLWVMNSFRRYLERLRADSTEQPAISQPATLAIASE